MFEFSKVELINFLKYVMIYSLLNKLGTLHDLFIVIKVNFII